jgi:hypothetical protein
MNEHFKIQKSDQQKLDAYCKGYVSTSIISSEDIKNNGIKGVTVSFAKFLIKKGHWKPKKILDVIIRLKTGEPENMRVYCYKDLAKLIQILKDNKNYDSVFSEYKVRQKAVNDRRNKMRNEKKNANRIVWEN